MKRVLSVLLVGLLGVTLTACGGDSDSTDSSNLLKYSNFEGTSVSDIKGWSISNSESKFGMSNGMGFLIPDGSTWEPYMVRFASNKDDNTFALEAGGNYEITFTAKSSVKTDIQVQIGEMLEADPWFNSAVFDPYAVTIYQAEAEYSIPFKAIETTEDMNMDNLSLCIEAGHSSAAQIGITGVSVHKTDKEPTNTFAPKIEWENGNTIYTEDGKTYSKADLLDLVKFTDDILSADELTTSTETIVKINDGASNEEVDSIDASTPGRYEIKYKANDGTRNTFTTLTLYVADRLEVAIGENVFTMTSNEGVTGTYEQSILPTFANQLLMWKESGQIDAAVTVDNVNGSKIVATYGCSWNWYDPQMFFTTSNIGTAGTYQFTTTVTCSEDRNVIVAGQNLELKAGVAQDITVEVEITEGQAWTMVVQFNWVDQPVATPGGEGYIYPTLTLDKLLFVRTK